MVDVEVVAEAEVSSQIRGAEAAPAGEVTRALESREQLCGPWRWGGVGPQKKKRIRWSSPGK